MTLSDRARSLTALGAALGMIAAGVGWALTTRSMAEEAAERSRSVQEITDSLVKLHEQQQAAEEARRQQLRELCARGKLPRADCAAAGFKHREER